MTIVQKISAKVATFAAVLAVSALSSNVAQAATVTGTISGTWVDGNGFSAYAQGLINLDDPFTATYSYDDTVFSSQSSNSGPDYYQSSYTSPLLSLEFTSGAYSHTFDFTNGGAGSLYFVEQAYAPPTYGTAVSQLFMQVDANDPTAPGQNSFTANRVRQQTNGVLSGGSYVGFYSRDPITDTYPAYAYTYSDANFSDDLTAKALPTIPATAVPTPALLPGLIGMGIAAFRKRKQEKAEAVKA